MGSGEWGVGKRCYFLLPTPHSLHCRFNRGKYEDRILSRPGYLETRYGNRGGLLSSDQNLSERRIIRNDIPTDSLFAAKTVVESGEQGVGSGKKFPFPIPHSPLPTPHSRFL